MNWDTSKELYREACKLMPGGVNSRPIGRAVGFDPLFIKKADGGRITDEDGNVYIDYVGSWGPLILGHSHPDEVVEAVDICEGSRMGFPSRIEMARKVVEMVPSIEMVQDGEFRDRGGHERHQLPGSMRREKIIKFNGCYHGHADSLLVKSGSGILTFASAGPGSPPRNSAAHDLAALQ